MAIADGVQRIGAPVRRWARTQKREYTNGEARPLAGDLGAMGVYVGLVTTAAAAVRASGRELPERIPVGDALLLTVATFRLARRIAKDPVTAPLRAPFTRFEGASGHAEVAEEVREHGGVKHAVGELVTCPFCLAQWVGTGFVFGYVTAPKATRLAALTMTMIAGSDVLQFVYDGIQSGGRAPGSGGGAAQAAPRRGAGRLRRPRASTTRPPRSGRRSGTVGGGPSLVRGRSRAARPAASTRTDLSCDLDPDTGPSRGPATGQGPHREGAACDRSGAGPCRSASSASA